MVQKIPDLWREKVVAILRTGDSQVIRVTCRAATNWGDMFGEFLYELYAAFADALSSPEMEGRPVVGMVPPGETWEFIFEHKGRKVYGKVSLLTDGKIVLIYSAHVPLKGDEL